MAWAVDNGNMIAGSFFLGTEYRLDFNKFYLKIGPKEVQSPGFVLLASETPGDLFWLNQLPRIDRHFLPARGSLDKSLEDKNLD